MSIENLYARNCGSRLSCNAVKKLTQELIREQFADLNLVLAIESNLNVMNVLDRQIKVLEQAVLKQAKLDPRYQYLLSIGGIGQILALTIMLETGKIERFKKVGNVSGLNFMVNPNLRLSGQCFLSHHFG